jgi:hypothetical protein
MKCIKYIPTNFVEQLKQAEQTGMGYQVVSVILKDGRAFEQVAASEGCFIAVRGHQDIPFSSEEVISVKVNHKRWNFRNRTDAALKARSATA